jgi:ribosomal protein L30E
MAKRQESDEIQELKKELQSGTALIGKERVLKALRARKLKKVYFASNNPDKVMMEPYIALGQVEVVALGQTNEELGILCKKNFFVSVVGIEA